MDNDWTKICVIWHNGHRIWLDRSTMDMGQPSWHVGDAIVVRSGGRSMVDIGVHKGTCRNEGADLEGGKLYFACSQSCKMFSKSLRD